MPDRMEIDAKPEKSFFLEMLTRDISLEDCILDLLDNSVDSAIRQSQVDVMDVLLKDSSLKDKFQGNVTITISEDKFELVDTCGGMSKEEARSKVFRFGYSQPPEGKPRLGVYGIGMKRALFKIGREIMVESSIGDDVWCVDIDTEEWAKKPKWTFAFSTRPTPAATMKLSRAGTRIQVTKLHAGVGEKFALTTFQNSLRRRIGTSHALFIVAGIRLMVNGEAISPKLPRISQSDRLKPSRKLYTYGKNIQYLIFTGVTEKKDISPHGWYVFCNGRMILEADKTPATGWGDNFPQYHTKFNHFAGYVYFRSNDVASLPWTTTKHSVSWDSPVYQDALANMQVQARPVLNFLSGLYPGDLSEEGVGERHILARAQTMNLEKLPKRDRPFEAKTPKSRPTDDASISYKRKRAMVDRVKKALGKPCLSLREVGERTFDYFVEMECD